MNHTVDGCEMHQLGWLKAFFSSISTGAGFFLNHPLEGYQRLFMTADWIREQICNQQRLGDVSPRSLQKWKRPRKNVWTVEYHQQFGHNERYLSKKYDDLPGNHSESCRYLEVSGVSGPRFHPTDKFWQDSGNAQIHGEVPRPSVDQKDSLNK